MKTKVIFLALLAALLGWPTIARAQDVVAGVTVSTFSGSGAVGFDDGSAGVASYVMPTALAYDARGYLYVVDSGAQRIRRVDDSGAVITIAGSGQLQGLVVAGGYADGLGDQAKFSTPSGIAIAPSGTIYISDTYNHCIRAISPTGLVSTYAGAPLRPGYQDGPRETARFSRPLGLALDAHENLYVADADVGIREIESATGTVRTLQLAVFSPFNLAILPGRSATSSLIVVADAHGFKYIDGDRHEQYDLIDQFSNFRMFELPPYHQLTQGSRPLGNPYGVTAIGNHTIAFTDLRGYSVRTLDLDSHALSILAGPSTEDAAQSGGGNQDGPGATARFGAPMGIAMSAAGGLAVADAGSRRIRVLSGFQQRTALSVADVVKLPRTADSKYRIGYVGNSSIWWDTDWSSSIASRLESSLASDVMAQAKKPPEVLPIYLPRSTLSDSMEYLQSLVGGRTLDAVVLQINSGSILGDVALRPANSLQLSLASRAWTSALTQNLRSLNVACRRNGVALLVVVHPMPWELAPNESLMYDMLGGYIIPNSAIEPDVVAAVKASGARMLDLWPDFLTALKQPHHAALFGSYDFHFTAYGRSVAARAIADELARWAPWKT